MKESISITAIFGFVILFIMLFACIMSLTINNSNAFGIKDQVINIIEANDGKVLSKDKSLSSEIVNLLKSTSYRSTGTCDDGFTGYNRSGAQAGKNEKAAICIRKIKATVDQEGFAEGDFVEGYYYQVEVFYHLSLPIISYAYDFKVLGETKIIYVDET